MYPNQVKVHSPVPTRSNDDRPRKETPQVPYVPVVGQSKKLGKKNEIVKTTRVSFEKIGKGRPYDAPKTGGVATGNFRSGGTIFRECWDA